MDRLHLMSVYIAVAEAEGFAGAARKLGMSPPAVTRAIASLEDYLGVKLLNRTTRYVRVTEAGQKYLEDAKRVIAAADEADDAVLGINSEPRGHIAVTASVLFGRLFVMPGIVDFMKLYKEMEVSALFVDRVVNMLEEGIDVAIRIGDLPDSSYRALNVGSVRQVLCASPDYLAEFGAPKTPDDLHSHQIILARGLTHIAEFNFLHKNVPLTVKLKPKLMVSDNASAIIAAGNGLGITRLLSYQVAKELAAGSLKVILNDFEPKPLPIHIVHREGRHSAVKIRAFVDLIVEKLRSNSALN